ncbi:MAG TPA: YkvA family protein [Candidatus Saccharimonadales bacterium]|nr:YkvA family protein [Candidatus Saccharimonadales bacterium]
MVLGAGTASAVFDENNPASISVTLTVPDTSLTINGRTSPHAFVTVKDNGGTAGTGVAGSSGNFNILLGSRAAGTHSIEISAVDNEGSVTDTVSYTINLSVQTNTTLNLFLPPTVSTRASNTGGVKAFLLYGYTIPNAQVTLVIDSSDVHITTSNHAGRWQLNLTALGISSGAHHVVAQAEDSSSNSSYITQSKQIDIPAPIPDVINDNGTETAADKTNLASKSPTAPKEGCIKIHCSTEPEKLPTFQRLARHLNDFSADNAKAITATAAAAAGFYALFLGGVALAAKGLEAGEIAAIVPSGPSLLKNLMSDPRLGLTHKIVLTLAAGYMLSPLDLVPDFLPVVGYMDDAIILILAIKFIARHFGLEIISEHWHGPEKVLEIIIKLARIK